MTTTGDIDGKNQLIIPLAFVSLQRHSTKARPIEMPGLKWVPCSFFVSSSCCCTDEDDDVDDGGDGDGDGDSSK